MKIKQKNEETGEEEEIEVYTNAEVEAKINEKNAEWEGKIKEKETAFSTLEADKKKIEEDLEKLKGNENNPSFKTLKEALDKKDDAINQLRNDIESDKKTRQTEAFDAKIKIASRGDAELEKKIRHHLENTVAGMKDGTDAERKAKVEAALKLSLDHSQDGPDIFDNGTGGGDGGGEFKNNAGENEFTAKERALGKKLGITDEDYKKYKNKVSKRPN